VGEDPKILAHAVLSFIAECARVNMQQISLDTAINLDLGIDGDDASELLEAFSSKFGVDLSTFRFDRYFASEPSLLWLFLAGGSRAPLTIRDLVQIAYPKTWGQV
jgi:hypothetical protein